VAPCVLQVELLADQSDPDIPLLAARSITGIADVLPSACSTIVRHKAVKAFVEKLNNIEFIDLAEQSLQVCYAWVVLVSQEGLLDS
jgi:E3 ubiquitin-protein ligase TRIP12